jgi:hypothetical protein
MADDKGWAGAVPELYFDLIGRIPPGLFLSLVLLIPFASDSQWFKGDVSKIDWSPSLIAFVLLFVASYSIGLLISPVGKRINKGAWDSAWQVAARNEIPLLKKAQPYLNLDIQFEDGGAWENLTPQQRGLVYRHMHELLKVNLPEAKLLLPRLAAELTFALNFIIVIPLASALLFIHWTSLHWPVWHIEAWRSPNLYVATSILLLAFFSSRYSAKERTQHLVERHFAFLGAYLNENQAPVGK